MQQVDELPFELASGPEVFEVGPQHRPQRIRRSVKRTDLELEDLEVPEDLADAVDGGVEVVMRITVVGDEEAPVGVHVSTGLQDAMDLPAASHGRARCSMTAPPNAKSITPSRNGR